MVRAIREHVKGCSGMGQCRAMYIVIMAGGGGTRLWPLSSPERPKPFLRLFEEGTLFQRSVGRVVGPELDLGPADVTVVATGAYAALARQQAPGVGLLEEPEGRNTAAAIALATLAIDRPDDEVTVVLPADHLVTDEAGFRTVIRAAALGLARGAFGIAAPRHPRSPGGPAGEEFGYLIPDLPAGQVVDGLLAYPLERFEEKPDPDRAILLQTQPGVAWNAGMFLWQRGAIRAALERFAPDILVTVEAGLAGDRLAEAYDAVRATSIDYAVMEPASGAASSRWVRWTSAGATSAAGPPCSARSGRPARVGSSRPARRRRPVRTTW